MYRGITMSRRLNNTYGTAGHSRGVSLLACTLIFLTCWGAAAGSERPVTRDDFISCDTSADSLGSPVWPSVTIDEAGGITLLNLRQQITDQRTALRLFLSSFDRMGNLTHPTTKLLPDTLAGDSVCWPSGLTHIESNGSGLSFVPVHTTVIGTDHQTYGRGISYIVMDSTETVIAGPARVVFVPMEGGHYRPHMAIGDMNSRGQCGSVWIGSQVNPPYQSKLLVRLFDAVTGKLGKSVVPSSLPAPPDLSGFAVVRTIKGPPAFSMNDIGGFAVAWIGEAKGDARLLFAVYDSLGRPRGPVRFADPADTSRAIVRTINSAGEADGDFYLVWSEDQIGLSSHHRRTHLWMRGFDIEGAPKYDAVRVDDADSTNIIDIQIVYPSIACDDSGNVLIAWADGRLHSDSHSAELKQDVFVQRFAPDGSRVGENSRVNNACGVAGLKGTHSDCALNNAGQAIVVWREFGEANTIKGQLSPLESIGRTVPGDLNCDLAADDNDLAALRDYLLGNSPNIFWPRSLADPNGDGVVDVADLVYLTDFLNNGGDAPVAVRPGIE